MPESMKRVESIWQRFGSLINTAVIVVTALVSIYAYVYTNGRTSEKLDNRLAMMEAKVETVAAREDNRWIEHQAYHKDRLAEVKEREGSVNARLSAVEAFRSTVERLDYRLTVVEQAQQNTAATLKETNQAINQITGDLRVIKEIVQRNDRSTATRN